MILEIFRLRDIADYDWKEDEIHLEDAKLYDVTYA